MNLYWLIKNKVIFYMASRYVVYFLQFLTSVLVAAKLGPYYMGIWGFLLLLITYCQQFHFGIANSLNVLIVHNKNSSENCKDYIGNSLILTGYLSLFVIIAFLVIHTMNISLLEKYHAHHFLFYICLIAILQYFNLVSLNVFRVKNMLNELTFCQSIVVIINFCGVFLFEGINLIWFLIFGYIIGNFLIIVVARVSNAFPAIKEIRIKSDKQFDLLMKGIMLFLYNSCFFFIIISIKTIISNYYEVSEFGLFTFSFSVGQAVMLLLDAFSFLIFPKLIDRLSSPNFNEVKDTLDMIRTGYISSAHLLVYCALLVFPYVFVFLPQYNGALTALNLISLSILMNTNSFGFSTLLIARNKEKTSARISFVALLINVILGIILARWLNVDFSFVIIATMITYFIFSCMVFYSGSKLIGIYGYKYLINNIFPLRLLIPYASAIIICSMGLIFLRFIPLLLFILLNISVLREIYNMIKKIVKTPNVINV